MPRHGKSPNQSRSQGSAHPWQYNIKYLYFVNLSMTIKIESYLILILDSTKIDNLMIKFIATFYYTPVGAAFTFSFYKVYVLSTYSFSKSYISVFSFLHTFSFLKNSRSVRFVLMYDRFLNDPPFKGHNSGNRFLYVIIKKSKFIHL
jgi:hypothetical protein